MVSHSTSQGLLWPGARLVAPTTTDAIMDCSAEFSLQSLCEPPTARDLCPFAPGEVCKSNAKMDDVAATQNCDRWFKVDSSGDIMYVDNDFSFADSSFMETADDMDEDVDSSCCATASPAAPHPPPQALGPAHSRNLSYASTCTPEHSLIDNSLWEDDSFIRADRDATASFDRPAEKPAFLKVNLSTPDKRRPTPEPESRGTRGLEEDERYIRNSSIPLRGWFHSCRSCGSWTGSIIEVAGREIPMCGRCKSKWGGIVHGEDPGMFSEDGKSDLLKKHVRQRLNENCQSGQFHREVVCQTALLEVHQAWVIHNGEDE